VSDGGKGGGGEGAGGDNSRGDQGGRGRRGVGSRALASAWRVVDDGFIDYELLDARVGGMRPRTLFPSGNECRKEGE